MTQAIDRNTIIKEMTPNINIKIGIFRAKAGVAQTRRYNGTAYIEFNEVFMEKTGDAQKAFYGLLVHELGHIRYNSFDDFIAGISEINALGYNESVYGLILNLVEDGRIEYKTKNEFPELFELLEFVKRYEDVNDYTITFKVEGDTNRKIALALKGMYYFMRQGDMVDDPNALLGVKIMQKYLRNIDTARDSVEASKRIYGGLVEAFGKPTNIKIIGMELPAKSKNIIEASHGLYGYK